LKATELNIRDISPLSVLVGTLFQADSAGQFPALKVLRLENMRWVYQTFLDMITGVKVPTLVLTHIKHENLHINGRRTSPDDLITDIFEVNEFLKTIRAKDVAGAFMEEEHEVFHAPGPTGGN
jgi:hypothetical protein